VRPAVHQIGKLARAKSRLKGLERLVEIADMPEVLDGLRHDVDQQKKEVCELEDKLKSA
jgi:hypothetical protein